MNSKPQTPREAIVVAHTHWDREWYLPFERFRSLLVQLVDQVLEMLAEHPEFVFMLDGQTAVLEDYLEIRPEQKERLQAYVKAGRLLIGPWYTQPDEFLVSGEALVRNLLWGLRQAEAFGGAMREGYVPDLFGHLAQLPQIFRGFGIESAFLMRGVGEYPEKTEFWWQGPDGSRLWVHRFAEEYGNAPRLDDEARLVRMTGRLAALGTTPVVLWMHGNDHRAPQRDLLSRLEALSGALGIRLRLGTLADYRTRVQAHEPRLEQVEGELRESKHAFLLSNVLSTRVYLKQANDRVLALLERFAEPISSLAWALGEAYPKGFLNTAWRLVLQNHAHDSICGCSLDEVHREVETRFDRARQIAEQVIEDRLHALAGHIPAAGAVVVFNPNPWPWRGRVETLWSLEEKRPPQALEDERGRRVAVVEQGRELRSVDVLDGVRHLPHARIAFYAEVPPFGYRTYRPASAPPQRQKAVLARVEKGGQRGSLENEWLKIEIERGGTIKLTDKRTGTVYAGLLALEDQADRGDEYTFMPVEGERPRRSSEEATFRVEVAEAAGDWATLRLVLSWPLPEGLTRNRESRTSRRIDHEIITELKLERGVPRLDVRLHLVNQARDHRLRVALPIPGARQAWAETAFAPVARPARAFVKTPPPGWREAPSPDQPLLRFVSVEGSKGKALTVATRGLHEYELSPSGTLFLTLLRSVGWLSRDDLEVRPEHAGPPYPTPEAQCLRPLTFHFALIPHGPGQDMREAWREALAYHTPPWAQRIPAQSKSASILPLSGSFLRIDPPDLVLSALKQAEAGDGLVLRLFNPTAEALKARVEFPLIAPERVFLANLEEQTLEALTVHEKAIRFSARPWEIVTLKLVFADSPKVL